MFKLPDFPSVDFSKFEMPKFEMPKIEMPKIEMPEIDLPTIDVAKLTEAVRDLAYLSVGLGVAAFGQVREIIRDAA
jgi:hypothetical protein